MKKPQAPDHRSPSRRSSGPLPAPTGEMPGGKTALVLAGGGIAGAVYEIGALQAINDMLVDRTVNDFDIYVGTSAGAWVSALLANEYTPQEILQSMEDVHPELRALVPRDLFQFNLSGILPGILRGPKALWRTGRHLASHIRDLSLSDLVWELLAILPNGLYDGRAMEHYMREILERPGSVNTFDQLAQEVYIVATELDTGGRAVFGRSDTVAPPISQAVAASCAIPLLFKPVRIQGRDYVDGGLRGSASVDLAIEAGARLVVCINPLVPYDGSQAEKGRKIADQGIQGVTNQVIRVLLHGSLHYHIKNLQTKYPDVDIILIEPSRDDLQMFEHNLMHYSNRLVVAQHGFETVSHGMDQGYDTFKQILARHGIPLNRSPRSTYFSAVAAEAANRAESELHTQTPPDHPEMKEPSQGILLPLQQALARLERNLSQLEQS